MLKLVLRTTLALAVMQIATASQAAPQSFTAAIPDRDCPQFFHANSSPQMLSPQAAARTVVMCFSGFAVNYSPNTKTSAWAAEYITPEKLQAAKQISREDNFHEETALPYNYQSQLSDYKGSGYDRGHLAPNGNRSNVKDQYESFSLVNIVPQSPHNNQNQWRNIEEATRTMVTKIKYPVFIITGGLYLQHPVQTIGANRVAIPSHMYKVVYYPTLNVAGAYVSVNDETAKTDVTSIAQLEKYSGIRFFPKISNATLLNTRYNLPLSANAAYKMKNITVAKNQASDIFTSMPSNNPAPGARASGNQNQSNQTSPTTDNRLKQAQSWIRAAEQIRRAF